MADPKRPGLGDSGKALSPHITEFSKQLQTLIHSIEEKRNVTVTPHAIEFMCEILQESLVFRQQEWKHKHDLSCCFHCDVEPIVEMTLISSEKILEHAEDNGQGYITLGVIVKTIHLNWCGVFPFC